MNRCYKAREKIVCFEMTPEKNYYSTMMKTQQNMQSCVMQVTMLKGSLVSQTGIVGD